MHDLDAMVRRLRVEVIHKDIRSADGLWLPEHRVIVLRRGMRRPHYRTVLAHELAHAALGHLHSGGKEEAQADRHAANMLITERDVRSAARYGAHINEIAHELCVTPRLLRVWMRHHFPG